jgi:splicing factor 3B subunit 2
MAGPANGKANGTKEMNGTKEKKRQLTKNEKRRLKKKQQKKEQADAKEAGGAAAPPAAPPAPPPAPPAVTVEYVSAKSAEGLSEEMQAQFASVFEQFSTAEELCGTAEVEEAEEAAPGDDAKAGSDGSDEDEDDAPKMGRKQRKKLKRLSVAELKQLVARPDVVEAHDITAADPRLLVFLKSYRNTVPVPRHWCHKRKYLQGKRGIEKPPFQLPQFIADTGIEKIRSAAAGTDADKASKTKSREKMAPKMGRMDIDYQVLHDAFFRFQTKPKLSGVGDLYYEGKEFEVKLKAKTPGVLSNDLKKALGMPEGAPPPWLINMQRYGPPPSYPSLKIAGLSAPIPEGASFGYHPGGWGKPPVDEYGRPLYGDVFGIVEAEDQASAVIVDKTLWGQMNVEDEAEEEEEEEEQDEEMDEGETEVSGMETPITTSGISSVSSGLETPDTIELRKSNKQFGTETPEAPQELFKVLEQKKSSVGGQIMGSSHTYAVPASKRTKMGADGVQVTLDADDLDGEIDESLLQEKYNEGRAAARGDTEDLSDVLAEGQRKMERKRKNQSKDGSKGKKFKDFKF